MTTTVEPAGGTTEASVIEPPALGLHADLSNEAYHADKTSLSSSGARKLIQPAGPAKFRWEQDNPQPPKKTFDIGNAAHKLVLGVGATLKVVDYDRWDTKAAKAEVAAVRAEGAIPLKQHEMDQVKAMAAAIREHPTASVLLDPDYGQPEVSAFWIDQPTGIRRRARFDWLPNATDGQLIVPDYKTCADASDEAFSKSVDTYGYNCQADWYIAGAQALGICGADAQFLFIAQEKEPPYLVNVIALDFMAMEIAAAKNRHAIEKYVECLATGRWAGYGDEPNYVSLPPWAEIRDKEIYL
ncbi:MAG: hypothetical protein HOZ81_04940 [Streptomyces sp.]|nr:hypothetical protein [Streptomyces sp.]